MNKEVFELKNKLPKEFYLRSSLEVAPDLIGCIISTNKENTITSGIITETEAYPGDDSASHTFNKKPTPRTSVQYYEGGHLYIYLIMGLHIMTSIVTNTEGRPDVVFIRSIEPIMGLDLMRKRRNYYGSNLKQLASGPGRLSQALGITKHDQGMDIVGENSTVNIYAKTRNYRISQAPRINLGVANIPETFATIAIQQNFRFFNNESEFLSI